MVTQFKFLVTHSKLLMVNFLTRIIYLPKIGKRQFLRSVIERDTWNLCVGHHVINAIHSDHA